MQSHTKSQGHTPKWSALSVEAVNTPCLIVDAYSAFHNYSIGNQILAMNRTAMAVALLRIANSCRTGPP